jgi:hypothetical protein
VSSCSQKTAHPLLNCIAYNLQRDYRQNRFRLIYEELHDRQLLPLDRNRNK